MYIWIVSHLLNDRLMHPPPLGDNAFVEEQYLGEKMEGDAKKS